MIMVVADKNSRKVTLAIVTFTITPDLVTQTRLLDDGGQALVPMHTYLGVSTCPGGELEELVKCLVFELGIQECSDV